MRELLLSKKLDGNRFNNRAAEKCKYDEVMLRKHDHLNI